MARPRTFHPKAEPKAPATTAPIIAESTNGQPQLIPAEIAVALTTGRDTFLTMLEHAVESGVRVIPPNQVLALVGVVREFMARQQRDLQRIHVLARLTAGMSTAMASIRATEESMRQTLAEVQRDLPPNEGEERTYMMDFKREPEEWNAAWSLLRQRDAILRQNGGSESQLGDTVSEHEGEHWQYMGSEYRNDRWRHTFRHRNHPGTLKREYVHVDASAGWAPCR